MVVGQAVMTYLAWPLFESRTWLTVGFLLEVWFSYPTKYNPRFYFLWVDSMLFEFVAQV